MRHSNTHVFLAEGRGTINLSPVNCNHFSFSNSVTSTAFTRNNSDPIRGEEANGAKPAAELQKEIKIGSFNYLKILPWPLIALRVKHKQLKRGLQRLSARLHQNQQYTLNSPPAPLRFSFGVVGAGDV